MMIKDTSPKRLQKEKDLDRALHEFLKRYVQSAEEGDRFLSGLYMDEIVQTILMKRERKVPSEGELRELLGEVRSEIPQRLREDFNDDLEIEMRKRFPEKYEVGKSERVEKLEEE